MLPSIAYIKNLTDVAFFNMADISFSTRSLSQTMVYPTQFTIALKTILVVCVTAQK